MRATYVKPEGNPDDCVLAFVGEQPGRQEILSRKPFVGAAGKELNTCLTSVGISRFDCYLTNVIKDLDLPLEKYVTFKKGEGLFSADGSKYVEELKEELSKCKANVIVAIGNVALFALTSRYGITKWRGSVLESTLLPGRKVIPIVHPATVIPPKNVYLNRRLIIHDLVMANDEAATPKIESTLRYVKIAPTFYESLEFLKTCYDMGKEGTVIDFDIEVYNYNISCISFSYSPIDAISIPFIYSKGDYFDMGQELEVWKAIALTLEDSSIRKRGQNVGFDMTNILSRYQIRTHNVEDTMVAQKILFPDYPMGLDFIASTCTDIPYYKADGKRWFKIGGLWETLWHYNGMDSITCAAASPIQHEDLEKQGNTVTYDEQCRIIEPLVYMMRKGIRVDVEGMKKADVEMKEQIGNLQEQLNSVAGRELNVNSFPQMREYFYGVLGHKPYLKKGKITTDDIALTRLLRKGVKEAGLSKQIRTLRKLSSTYTDISKIDFDGYIRCSYNPVGTVTGRLSSSADIYDKGMNMQNWPHHLLKYLLADEGYVYYGLDLSQAENRIVAYIGRIQRMMQAFENEEDVHALTAGLIFDKPVDKISDEEGSSDLGTGAYSERFWGKKSNHSFNYDLGYKSFAMRMEMEERQAKWIVERYHKIYPEVRGNYHTMVRMNLSKDRTLTNLFGRKRLFLGEWGDNLFKDAYAQIPQSTVADKINRQGLSYIYYNQEKFSPVELLVQVHDSIGLQLPLSLPWIKHAEILLDIKTSLEAPLDTGAIEFVIPVDIQMGLNLFKKEGKEFKHNEIPLSAPNFAKELEQTYNGLIKE